MLVSEYITRLNYALRGIDDDAPISGSDEWNYWLSVLNRKKDELYEDVTKQWSVTYEARGLGTIAASAAPSFDLDDDFLAPSDSIYIVTNEGVRRDYVLIKPQEKNPHRQEAFIAGQEPQVIYFTKEILAGADIIGGTLYLPAYFMPDDFTDENDTVLLPDPNWGVLAAAAEIAGNDIVYEDKEANLTAKANNLYDLMVKKNRRGTFLNPRKAQTNVQRIRGF